MVCDALNMCKGRTNFIRDGLEFKEIPNFCPFCGKKWWVSAIPELEENKPADPKPGGEDGS